MNQENRHLAAILFADIVGYSRVSHRDEKLALRLVKEHREIVRPLLAKFEGREIKTMGDGFLAVFSSVQQAVLCAIEMQKAHIERNAREIEKIELRVGIHVSDVVPSEGDVYGDGVNIAARLMQTCKPGRICVSSGVMDQARQVIPHWISTLGPTKFKGISNEIHAYSICVEYPADRPPPLRFRAKRMMRERRRMGYAAAFLVLAISTFHFLAPKPGSVYAGGPKRIAVLPLQGIGLTEEYDYLPEGITDELISSLSELKTVRVLSQASSEIGRNLSLGNLRVNLGVSYVVEGSVQRANDALRIRVRLIDTESQESLWSKEFEEKISNTFALEKKVASQISGQFTNRSPASLTSTIPEPDLGPQPDPAAYQHYLKARYLMETRTRDGIFKSLEQLEQSIQLDPNFAPALAAAAQTYLLVNFYGYTSPREANEKGERYAKKALELDPANSDALLFFAEQSAYEKREFETADGYYRKAIENNPNSSTAFQWYGKFLTYVSRFPEAKLNFEKAVELDPLSQTSLTAAASVDFYQERFDATIKTADKAIGIDPDAILPHLWKGKALLMKGAYNGALSEFRFVSEHSRDSSYLYGFETMALARSGKSREAVAQMNKVLTDAKTGYIGHYTLARIYHALGKRDDTLRELELAAKTRESQAASLKVDPFFRELRVEARFQALLKELNLVI